MTFTLILIFGGTGLLGQLRQVDQGRSGTSPWTIKICTDSTGTQCVGTETTGTPGVYRLLTSTSGGGAGGGTVAQGAAGATAWPMTLSGVTVTIPVSVTNPSLPVTQSGSWTMPVTESGAWGVTASLATGTNTFGAISNSGFAVTNTTTATPVSIRCVDTTGTVFVNCGPTAVTSSQGGAWGVTSTIANTTAAPVVDGGRAQTTTYAPVANGAAVAYAVDKYGRQITMPCAQDMIANGTFTLTATTASTILAATDTNTRYLLMTVYACNTSTAATRLDIRDNTTALFAIVWTQTTNVGEERCYTIPLNPPYVITASNPVTVALGTAVTDVRGFIGGCKTGT